MIPTAYTHLQQPQLAALTHSQHTQLLLPLPYLSSPKHAAAKLENRTLVGLVSARQNPDIVNQLAEQGATVFALDMLLRTLSRGQSFDVLSSQANIAGYRAVIEYVLDRRLHPPPPSPSPPSLSGLPPH